jgi:hypothetical protein
MHGPLFPAMNCRFELRSAMQENLFLWRRKSTHYVACHQAEPRDGNCPNTGTAGKSAAPHSHTPATSRQTLGFRPATRNDAEPETALQGGSVLDLDRRHARLRGDAR